MNICCHEFHTEWNDVIMPQKMTRVVHLNVLQALTNFVAYQLFQIFSCRKEVAGVRAERNESMQTQLIRVFHFQRKGKIMRTQMHHQWLQIWIATAIILSMTGTPAIRAKDAAVKLPDGVLAVINARYPGCAIRNVELGNERKITVFEVTLNLSGRIIELEIAGAGNIVKTEEVVASEAVPAALKTVISKLTGSGHHVKKIEKHEILCVQHLGAFRELSKPILFYDVKTRDLNGKRRSVLFEQDANLVYPKGQTADGDDDNGYDDDDDD